MPTDEEDSQRVVELFYRREIDRLRRYLTVLSVVFAFLTGLVAIDDVRQRAALRRAVDRADSFCATALIAAKSVRGVLSGEIGNGAQQVTPVPYTAERELMVAETLLVLRDCAAKPAEVDAAWGPAARRDLAGVLQRAIAVVEGRTP